MSDRRRAATPGHLPAVLLLVVGILLAVGAPTGWALTHRDPALTPIGQGVAVALAADGPTGPKSATLASVPTARTAMPTTAAPTSARAAMAGSSTGPVKSSAGPVKSSPATSKARSPRPSVSPAPVNPPARLRIPAIGVDAPVRPVGIDARGEMAIPEQVTDIGWYRYGPAAGAASGSAVVSGHVDSAQQGLGAFSRLGELRAGDVITVIDAAGRQLRYRVVGKEAFDKKTVPLAELFSRSGAARLTLITCGGAFDSGALSYVDNIVVTAVPA